MAWALPMELSKPTIQGEKIEAIKLSAAPKATVVAFLSARCPCSASHEVALKTLAEQYAGKGFQFVGIHSNADEDTTLTRAHFAEAKLPFAILEDSSDASLADAFGAIKTPHVFVVSPQGDILYQGGVDNSKSLDRASKHYLKEVLAALDAGKEAPVKLARTLGCAITRP